VFETIAGASIMNQTDIVATAGPTWPATRSVQKPDTPDAHLASVADTGRIRIGAAFRLLAPR
jgi:hypothetical protein